MCVSFSNSINWAIDRWTRKRTKEDKSKMILLILVLSTLVNLVTLNILEEDSIAKRDKDGVDICSIHDHNCEMNLVSI